MKALRAAAVTALALAALAVSFPAGLPARAQTTAPFARLAAVYVAQSEARDPLFADQLGIHTFDDRLDDYSAAGHRARLR